MRWLAFGVFVVGIAVGCTISAPNPREGLGGTGGLEPSGGGTAGGGTGGLEPGGGGTTGAGTGGLEVGGRNTSGDGGEGDVADAGSGGWDQGQAGAAGSASVDPCLGLECNTPPGNDCESASQFKSYDSQGSCAEGVCSYVAHSINCDCRDHACTTDPCIGVTCTSPPSTVCKDGSTLTTYAANGTCGSGSCSYAPKDKVCPFGCAHAACKADPCLTMTCNAPPSAACKDTGTRTTYASSGTCANATCSYAPTDAPCGSNKLCAGAGACTVCKADASCGASCTACGNSTPKCKDLGTTSRCVACLTNADCSGGTPVCNTTTNSCVARPSCAGLAATCGPAGNGNCCAWNAVPGGTFYRGQSGAYSTGFPATVSNFRLDTYEITVGRMRKFVAAYGQTMIPQGAGKNPNNESDPGWDAASWNAQLPPNAAALIATLKEGGIFSWTDSPGTAAAESRPITYLSWHVAAAFCIWDGGRLPTEAEWGYAAAGGAEQRLYAWGDNAPAANTALAVYGCYFNATGTCSGVTNIAPVGSSPAGNGKWGQADLTGNVAEWLADRGTDFPTPCVDCLGLSGDPIMIRGGSYYSGVTELPSPTRGAIGSTGSFISGGRCAL